MAVLSRDLAVWDHVVAAAARRARRNGALVEILTEARRRRDLPVHRRLLMIRWAVVIHDDRPLPEGFRPSQHLGSDVALEAARLALEDRVSRVADALAREQLIGLTGSTEMEILLSRIEDDICTRIAERAMRPKRGDGIDPAALVPIVADVTRRLEQAGIRPFLMSGTLLGFIRNGTFLEHDHDVDLGLLPEVDLDAVERALAGCDLELTVEVDGLWLLGVHPTGLHIDFFRHELRDGRFWHSTRVHSWWNTPFELRTLDAEDQRWWIPDDPDLYLEENYGEWTAPVAFYDISFDTPNRTYRASADAARQLYMACIRGLDSGDRWMVESAVRELRDQFGIDAEQHLVATPLLRRDRVPTDGHPYAGSPEACR
jgi:hypothetical protein